MKYLLHLLNGRMQARAWTDITLLKSEYQEDMVFLINAKFSIMYVYWMDNILPREKSRIIASQIIQSSQLGMIFILSNYHIRIVRRRL